MTDGEAQAEALRRIDEARRTSATVLDLGDLRLAKLPEELGQLQRLLLLGLGRNAVAVRGDEIVWEWMDTRPIQRFPNLSVLSGLTALQSLDLSWCEVVSDLSVLSGLTALRSLNLQGCTGVSDLSGLAGLNALQSLKLSHCRSVSDLSALIGLNALQSLDLQGCRGVSDLSGLVGLSLLQSLTLWSCTGLSDLSGLSGLHALQSLNLWGCTAVSDLSGLSGLGALQALNLSACTAVSDLSVLSRLTALRSLNLQGCSGVSDLSGLAGLHTLQWLDLSFCLSVSDLSGLTGLTSLRALDLSDCRDVSDLSALSGLTTLQSLDLSQCTGVRDLSGLAALSALQSLNLSACTAVSDLSVLAGLTALQSLNLQGCRGVSDLSVLAELTVLQSLNLQGCRGVSDLSVLVGLTSLQSLNLSKCINLRRFLPLRPLLDHLTYLQLNDCAFNDLPAAICGLSYGENVLPKVRAHYADLDCGASEDAERKLFILGNGGVGKTQTRRRLCGQDFDPTIPSTHGVEIEDFALPIEGRTSPVTLRIWDFGGQDIYHGTHALFLQTDAAFLILWTPESETGETVENGIRLRNRPLVYWLDYVRNLVGTRSPVLVVRNKCDGPQVPRHPLDLPEDFPFLRSIEFSARKGNMGVLKAHLAEAVGYLLNDHPTQQIGVGRATVRQRLRDLLAADRQRPPAEKQHRTLARADYLALCSEAGNVSDPDALLDFLHLTGVVYHRPGQFDDRIILDQNWALDAIYTVLHREKTLPHLMLDGRFTRLHLAGLAWQQHSEADQRVLLDMMESCRICFPLRKLSNDRAKPEWLYVAPDLLPEWDEARSRLLLGRLRGTPPDAAARLRYPFLHEGILRTFLSKVGAQARDAGVYWRYGCWFGEEPTQSTILVRSSSATADSAPWSGEVTLEAWGEKANDLLDLVLKLLLDILLGQRPEVERTTPPPHSKEVGRAEAGPAPLIGAAHAVGLPGESKQVFVSYAWGEDTTAEGRRHDQQVEQLCEQVKSWGYEVIRDKERLRPGDLISDFMKLAGLTPRVLVILNAKYLRSVFCMTELHEVHKRCYDSKEFQRRIAPLPLPEAHFHSNRDRGELGLFWLKEVETLAPQAAAAVMAPSDYAQFHQMRTWAQAVPVMLALIADMVTSVGFDDAPEKIRARLA
jgi:internalin A